MSIFALFIVLGSNLVVCPSVRLKYVLNLFQLALEADPAKIEASYPLTII